MGHAGVKGDGGSNLGQLSDPALGHPIRHQVDLVEHKDEVLVGRILNVFLDHGAARARDVTGVNDVQNDITAVEHLVELAPDTLGLALEEEVVLLLDAVVDALACGLDLVHVAAELDHAHAAVDLGVGMLRLLGGSQQRGIAGRIVGGCVGERVGLASHGGQLLLKRARFHLAIVLVELADPGCHVLLHLDPLAPALAAKGLLEGLADQQGAAAHAALLVELGRIPQQPQGQSLALHHHGVRVGHTVRHLLAEPIQIRRVHHAGVAKPAPVGGDAPRGRRDLRVACTVGHHKLTAHHLALLVADGLAVVVHLETGDGGGRAGVAALGGDAVLLGGSGGFDEHVAAALGGRLFGVLVASLDHLVEEVRPK